MKFRLDFLSLHFLSGLSYYTVPAILSYIWTSNLSSADQTKIKLTDIIATTGTAAVTTAVITTTFPTTIIAPAVPAVNSSLCTDEPSA